MKAASEVNHSPSHKHDLNAFNVACQVLPPPREKYPAWPSTPAVTVFSAAC